MDTVPHKTGIMDAQTLQNLRTDAAFARMIAHGHRPRMLAFSAIALRLQGSFWNDTPPAKKRALRARFDGAEAAATTTQEKGRTPMDAALHDRWLVPKRATQPTSSRPEKK